jgi:hypothetical protein
MGKKNESFSYPPGTTKYEIKEDPLRHSRENGNPGALDPFEPGFPFSPLA